MPLATISTSGMHSTSCPDMSVAASRSVDLGTSMSVDFDDRAREIQNTSTSVDDLGAYYLSIRNPSLVKKRHIDVITGKEYIMYSSKHDGSSC